MRVTVVLCKQHIVRSFKRIWEVQHKRKVFDYGVRQQLEARGIQVVDANEFLGLTKTVDKPIIPEKIKIPDGTVDESLIPKPPRFDKTHPDWHDSPARVYDDNTFLLTGIDEGLNLTKTCLVANQLPSRVESLIKKLSEDVHRRVQQAILTAHTLDAVQEKLPRTEKHPERPMWVFPRRYGVPKSRKNEQLLSKIFHIFDTSLMKEGIDVTQLNLSKDAVLKASVQVEGKPILFDTTAKQLFFGRKALKPYIEDEAVRRELLERPLPSIYPLKATISMDEKNVYRLENMFPVRQGAPFDRLSMAVFGLELPENELDVSQTQGRLLLHAFGAAAAYAQRIYGTGVKELPAPLVVNCVQSDTQNLTVGCLQLHSLDLDDGHRSANNLFWLHGPEPVFARCEYVAGRPSLEGYEPRAIERLMAVYLSQIAG